MLDNFLSNRIFQFFRFDILIVLRGNEHSVHAQGALIFVFNRNLRFSIGAQAGDDPLFAHLGQPFSDTVGEYDRQGH